LFAQTLWTDYAKPPKLKHSKKYNAPDNPYIIDSPEKLAYLALQVNSGEEDFQKGFYKQTKNIDLSGHLWVPIGLSEFMRSFPFEGYFNGNNKIIANLTVNGNTDVFSSAKNGLFGVISGGTLTNIILSNVNVQGCNSTTIRSFTSTGALAGLVSGKEIIIFDCHVRGGRVQGGNNDLLNTGGIIGSIDGEWTIKKCSNSSTVVGGIAERGGPDTGGIIGYVHYIEGHIIQCINTGTVFGGLGESNLQRTTATGGIIGFAVPNRLVDINKSKKVVKKTLSIDSCMNKGNIYGKIIEVDNYRKDDYCIGGIIGYGEHGIEGEGGIFLTNIRNTGIITATKNSDNEKPVNSYCKDLVGREAASNEYGGELHYW
jgi:hypothetical protein